MQLIPSLQRFYRDSFPLVRFMILCARMCQGQAAELGLIIYSVIFKAFLAGRWLMNDLTVKRMKECTVQKIGPS